MTKMKYPAVMDGKQLYYFPPELQALGNISGAVTINVASGNYVTATLTGNITLTLTDGEGVGQRMTLDLKQDGTGSRTLTTTAFKKAGGALTLTTTATTGRDIIDLMWNGTDWVEMGRSLAVA